MSFQNDTLMNDALLRLVRSTLGHTDRATLALAQRLATSQLGRSSSSCLDWKRQVHDPKAKKDIEAILKTMQELGPDEQIFADKIIQVLLPFQNHRPSPVLSSSLDNMTLTSQLRQPANLHSKEDSIEVIFYADVVKEEEALLRECIFALQGLSGERIRFSQHGLHARTPALQNPPLLPTQWSLLGSGGAMDALQICGQAGIRYRLIASYITTLQHPQSSSTARALASSLEQELQEYCSFLTSQVSNPLSLRHLLEQLTPALARLSILGNVVEGMMCRLPRGKAEPILASLHAHAHHHGDSRHANLVRSLWTKSVQPWLHMLHLWVTQGLLYSNTENTEAEFFVQQVPDVPDRDLWRHRFQMDASKVPVGALDSDLVEPAYLVGKGINYIRVCLQDGGWSLLPRVDENREMDLQEVDSGSSLNLRWQIQGAAKQVHSHILQSLREEYALLDHLFALKQFLLLGQGDFFSSLMGGLFTEFGERKGIVGIYRHSLSGAMETALKSSNASAFPPEILHRLEVGVLVEEDVYYMFGDDRSTSSDKRSVWDIFSLNYTLPDPLIAIIPPEAMALYKKMFSFLFGIRKVELLLNLTWRQSATLQREIQTSAQHNAINVSKSSAYSQANVLLRQISMTRQAMVHFVNNLKSYLMLAVLEGGWKHLVRNMDAAETLGELIQAHDEYLNVICRKSLLPASMEYPASDDLGDQVQELLLLSSEFCSFQEHIFGEALEAIERASETRKLAEERLTSGNWGFQSEEEISEQESFFGLADPSKLEDLDLLSSGFNERVVVLLKALDQRLHGGSTKQTGSMISTPVYVSDIVQDACSSQDDLDSLRFLEFQLDHNSFYGSAQDT